MIRDVVWSFPQNGGHSGGPFSSTYCGSDGTSAFDARHHHSILTTAHRIGGVRRGVLSSAASPVAQRHVLPDLTVNRSDGTTILLANHATVPRVSNATATTTNATARRRRREGLTGDGIIRATVPGPGLRNTFAGPNPGDCWWALHGIVYDATNYLDQHEGGRSVVASLCGTDATAALDCNHPDTQEYINDAIEDGMVQVPPPPFDAPCRPGQGSAHLRWHYPCPCLRWMGVCGCRGSQPHPITLQRRGPQ